MAAIKGISEFVETTATASITPPLPDHNVDDLLLVFAVGDNVISAFSAAGWTIGGQQQSAGTTTSACRAGWFYKVAATNNESITIGSSSTTWTVTSLAIEGANTSTPIDVSNGNGILINANPGVGTAFQAAAVTTTSSNALVLWTMFNSLSTPSPFPGIRTVSSHDSGLTGLGIGAYIQASTGSSGTWAFYTEDHASINQNSVSFTIAVADVGGASSRIPAYLDKTHAEIITPFRGATPSVRGEAWNTSNSTLYSNVPQLGRSQSKKVVQYDDSAATFTDVTTAANNSTTGDFNLLAGTPDVDDYIAWCSDNPFASLSGVHTTLGAGGTSTWEVLNGSTWTAITVTFGYWSSVNWTPFTWPAAPIGEKYSMVIAPADLRRISAIWKPSTLDGTVGYWMRNKFSSAPSTNPTCTYIVPSEGPPFYDAIGSATDTGGNAFHNSASTTPVVYSPTTPGLTGTYITLSGGVAPYDPSGKLLVGTFTFDTARDYVDAGSRSELSGIAISLFDASWNDRTYFVGGYQSIDTDQNGRNAFAIQWDAATKTYNNLNTTLTDISAVGVFSRQIRGAGFQNFNQLVAYEVPKISGGTSSNPITNIEFFDTFDISKYYPLPLIKDNTAIIPLQIGGGDAVHVELDTFSLSFAKLTTEPDAFNSAHYSTIHADENYLGLVFDGRSGDSIKLTNGIISAPDSWRFEVLNTASSDCTWDFSNTALVNATVTLKDVTSFNSMIFRNCSSIVLDNCTVNDAIIQSCATVEANGATMSGNTFIDSAGVNALTVDSTAEIDNIDSCSFVNNTRGLKITSAGTYNLDNLQFSGNTYDIENASTGLVTIRRINGSNPTTYINTNGGTTILVTPFTFTISNIIEDTEVRILKQSDLSELAGAEVVGSSPSGLNNLTVGSDPDNAGRYTATYEYDYSADVPVYVVIFNTGYKALRPAYILKAADSVLQAAQQLDRQYLNPV